MGVLAGITYTESKDSGQLSTDKGIMTGTRTFFVAWADRLRFIGALQGAYTIVNGKARRVSPPATFPDVPFLEATQISSSGVGTPDDASTDDSVSFTKAKVTATYTMQEVDEDDSADEEDETISTQEISFGAEYMTMPNGSYSWAEGTDNLKPLLHNIGMPLALIEHQFSRNKLTALPLTAIRACLNKVNDAIFLGAPIARVLFVGGRSRKTVTLRLGSSTPVPSYDLTLLFKERTEVWNKAWNVTDRAWLAFTPAPFPATNLNQLLTMVGG